LSSRVLAVWIVGLLAFAMLPVAQPQPVEAQDFDEHTIIKRECPPGFDPGSGDAQNAFDNCPTLHQGISFTLSSQDPAYQGVVRTTDVGGTTGWADIPAGSAYSIAESLPPGYGNPWVFCRIYEQLDDSGNSVEFYFQAPGGVMDVGLTDPSLIALRDTTCYWFNVPPAATEPAEPTATATTEPADTVTTITIQKRQCPFRYPYAAVSLAELQSNCAMPLRNVRFHINDDAATQQSTDTNGLLVFDNVPFGPVSIREEGYGSFDTARVFCQSHPVSDANVVFDPSNEVPFTAEDGDSFVVNVEATPGNKIDCLWFNAHITEEDLGSLIVTKYVCPEADDAIYVSLAELTHSCPEPQVGAYFELVQPGNISGGETDSNGVRPFQNYSPGAYDLRETEPAGYATARVYCYEHPGGTQVGIPDEFQEYTVTNQNQISIELKAGVELDCYWINIPVDANAGWVIVHKYYCNVSTNPALASHDGLLEACDRSLVGIPFELTNEEGTYQESRTIAQNADASWYDAPPGNLTLTETVPTGYQVARVFCGTTPQGSGAPSLMEERTYGDGLAFTMAAGSIYICEFFNTHIAENTNGFVDVYKSLCPPEFDHAAATTRDEFAQACSERITGVQFDIAGPNGYARSATSDFGTAFFQEQAPAGTLTITETPAQGQTLVRVFCGEAPYIGIGAIPDEWTDYADATQVEFDLTQGYQLVCEWYNVSTEGASLPATPTESPPDGATPTEEPSGPGPGTPTAPDSGGATVHKYVCTEGYDASIDTFEAYRQTCTEPQPGVGFEYETESNTAGATGTTNAEGMHGIGGFPAGGLTIRETPPTGYRTARIYCQSYPQDTTDPDPAGYQEITSTTQNEIELELQGGYQIDCLWFNELVPEAGAGTIIVHKYGCPEAYDDLNGVLTSLQTGCSTPLPGVHFFAAYEGGGKGLPTDASGTSTIEELPAGAISLRESYAKGYQPLRAFCHAYEAGQQNANIDLYDEYTIDSDGAIAVELQPGFVIDCIWFNLPVNNFGWVTAYTHVCPETLDMTSASRDALSQSCAEPLSGAQYLLETSDEVLYESQQTAGPDGIGHWDEAPALPLRLSHFPPPGYAVAKAYCGLAAQNEGTLPATWDEREFENGVLFDLQGGQYFHCEFYLISTLDYGTATITKYNCPEPTGPGEMSDEEYGTLCTDPSEGYSFSLQTEQGDEVDQGTTGPDGKVTLLADAEGTYRVVEQANPGYVTGAVHCNGENAYDESASPESEFWTSLLTFGPGVTWDCAWYNVPFVETDYDPGSIIIHKFSCPPGYPPESTAGDTPLEYLSDGCTVALSGISFNVEQGGQTAGSGETDATGTALITGVGAGTNRISELPREGYAPPRVFCSIHPSGESGVQSAYEEQTVESWGHSIDLAEGDILECYWFNFPNSQGEEGQPILIALHKLLCEPGYEYSGQSYETVSAECTTGEEGVNFDIVGGDGVAGGGPTGTNGYVEYSGIAPGSISIIETPRPGYQTLAVYCTAYTVSAGALSYFPTQTGQLDYYLADGYTFECFWFNVPVEQTGDVTVIKYLCPPDYDYAGKLQSDLNTDCSERLEGVPFTLSAGPDYSQTSSTDENGEVTWEDVPAVPLTIEEGPAELRPVRTFCGETPLGEPEAPPTQWDDYSPASGSVFGPHVSPGHHLYCEVYNLPEYGTIYIFKYQCDQQYAYQTRDEYYASCNQRMESVVFDITGEAGYTSQGMTSSNGLVEGANVPSGPVTIRETPPEGYVPYRVFCGTHEVAYIPPTTWNDRPIGSDYSITSEVTAPHFLLCEWYNMPYEEEPPQVWIQKYACPEEADHHWTYHQLVPECVSPAEGVRFEYKREGGQFLEIDTDALGQAQLTGLDPDTWIITERFPDGYDGVAVFCQFITPDHAGAYQRAEAYGGEIALELDDGYIVTCVWFNFLEGLVPPAASPPAGGSPPLQPDPPSGGTGGGGGGTGGGGIPSTGGAGQGTTGGSQTQPPVDPNAPATLIITKYTCEPSFDILLEDSDPSVDCNTLTDDISFELTSEEEDFEAQSGLTGGDGEGQVNFSDLPAGVYLLTEELPEGTLSAFIYTCTSDQREFQAENPFTPFAYAGPDGRIGVTLIPGETLECDWYDVPEKQAGGQVTIVKYSCPGDTVIVTQCVAYTEGAAIGLFPVGDSGEIVELVTGEDGTATAAMEGTYTVQELPDTACLIDSDAFDQEGNLVVNEGDEVEVLVYNCGMETDEGV
jgi:hypothetical protein